jgi:hypothetical protein
MRRIVSSLVALAVGAVAFVGTATAPASAADVHAKKGSTRVAIDPTLYELMTGFGVTVTPTGKATAEPFLDTLAIKFPITKIKKKTYTHTGGVTLAFGGADINTADYIINTKAGTATGLTTGSVIGDRGRIPLFTLSDSSLPDYGKYNLALTAEGADAVNDTFGLEIVSEGDLFAYATIKKKK